MSYTENVFLTSMPYGFSFEHEAEDPMVYLISRLDTPYQVHCRLSVTTPQAQLTFGAGYQMEVHVTKVWAAADSIVTFLKGLAAVEISPYRLRSQHV